MNLRVLVMMMCSYASEFEYQFLRWPYGKRESNISIALYDVNFFIFFIYFLMERMDVCWLHKSLKWPACHTICHVAVSQDGKGWLMDSVIKGKVLGSRQERKGVWECKWTSKGKPQVHIARSDVIGILIIGKTQRKDSVAACSSPVKVWFRLQRRAPSVWERQFFLMGGNRWNG